MFNTPKSTTLGTVLVSVDAKRYFKKDSENSIRRAILNKIKPVTKTQLVKYNLNKE